MAASSTSASASASSSAKNNVTRIVVEGCGLSEINGSYCKKVWSYHDSSVYTKGGLWKGSYVTYVILHNHLSPWYIGYWNGDADNEDNRLHLPTFVYLSHSNTICETPPVNGWRKSIRGTGGVDPPPKCRIQNNNSGGGVRGASTSSSSSATSDVNKIFNHGYL